MLIPYKGKTLYMVKEKLAWSKLFLHAALYLHDE